MACGTRDRLAQTLLALVVVPSLLVGCSHQQVTHTLTISASGLCGTSGPWTGGADNARSVEVRDPGNKLIGAATMIVKNSDADPSIPAGQCRGRVRIAGVAEVPLYRVTIVTVLGPVTCHLSELERDHWRVLITVPPAP